MGHVTKLMATIVRVVRHYLLLLKIVLHLLLNLSLIEKDSLIVSTSAWGHLRILVFYLVILIIIMDLALAMEEA